MDNYQYIIASLPVPNKDNFFQVLVELKKDKGNIPIELSGTDPGVTVSNPIYVNGILNGGTFDPSDEYQRIFRRQDFNTSTHTQIVIKFASEVPAGWSLHTYGGQFEGNVPLEGKKEYTIN